MIRNHSRSLFGALISACLVLGCVGSAFAADDSTAVNFNFSTHHIKNVFIILMENHNWTGDGNLDIKGNPAAPYINKTLLPIASHAENYWNPPGIHPSLPNYLWLVAGTNFGILDDNPPSQDHQSTTKHVVTLLKKAGVSWKAYEENITGKDCPLNDSGEYAVRHDPFVYFDTITDHLNSHGKYCIDHIRPYTELKRDLMNDKVAKYNFITPNVCDDMHDNCGKNPIAYGDKWLSKNVPTIINSTAYRQGGALFIVWDEADKGDGPIGMIVLSPFAKGNGYSNNIHYTHGSLLRTVEEVFSLKPLLGDAAKQKDLSDLFSVFP